MGGCGWRRLTTGGGGELSKDSAFWLKTAISAPRCVNRPLVLLSLRGLKNAVFSAKILESQSVDKKHAQAPHFYHPKQGEAAVSLVNPTASDFALESTFSMDSACSDKAGSLPFACAIDAQGLSPRKSLRNPAFSSTILESFAGLLTFLAFPKVDSSPKILESQSGKKNKHKLPNPTASDFALESTFDKNHDSISTILESFAGLLTFLAFPKVDSRGGDLSLRDTAEAVAWQSNSAPAESSQINGARKACNLESVQGDWGVKGGTLRK